MIICSNVMHAGCLKAMPAYSLMNIHTELLPLYYNLAIRSSFPGAFELYKVVRSMCALLQNSARA